ncbi:Rieske 2Fe-2S domain-containing protein [Kitasatospora sp. MY 5-36]|uniref:Rieske 2Fe-2S domain-containing protein n=1 Tax=Kitasatospora sp. MY 5-36 TaxID=1678027 RepID=UPI000671376C|nr:Rieske 2Fe-2S domain-containing protein [Kitasatospora sp. MY 5-36]
MRITSVGHAGLLVETSAGRILCDPWFNPAFFASWFPFPDNEAMDTAQLHTAEYLYVSHLHHDHFDAEWLRTRMSKDTVVLLPDYPVRDLRTSLEDLGFRHFVQTRDLEPTQLDGGVQVMVNALTSPTDGPIGDSAILIDDNGTRILNQNDARPVDEPRIRSFGPLAGHFLQYSGAIWYPMVYDFPARMKQTVGRRKRRNGMARALNYVEQYGAEHVFPFAGPPCFLDDELFHLNDLDGDDANIFPDQWVFLDFLRERGVTNTHLLLPGTVAELGPDRSCRLEQVDERTVARIRDDRTGYLREYQARRADRIRAEKAGWPTTRTDLLTGLREWVEPLLQYADRTCEGINGRVLVEVVDTPDATGAEEGADGGTGAGTGAGAAPTEQILFDFLDRRVARWAGEECRYRFELPRPLVERMVAERCPDWANELFLSCRFKAARKGPFNEFVTTFFASLSTERMAYVEGYYAELSQTEERARAGDHVVQRLCPHLKADLVRFGSHRDGILTCRLHDWEFDLATGRCLTSDDRKIISEARVNPSDDDPDLPEIPAA